jgi:hypothetical protein
MGWWSFRSTGEGDKLEPISSECNCHKWEISALLRQGNGTVVIASVVLCGCGTWSVNLRKYVVSEQADD